MTTGTHERLAPGRTPPTARPRPLRVVHVTFGLDVGGLERLLVDFARHGDPGRLRPEFLSIGSRGPLADEIEAAGRPVSALGEPGGLRPRLVLRLARRFRHLRPDVVHTHDNRPLFYAAPAARLARVPCVVHTRHGVDFGASAREASALPHAARLAHRVACVSEDCAAASRRAGIAGDRLRTIYNGIDISRFAFEGPTIGGSVVAVARLSPVKDVATLIRAVALASREDAGLRLEIAGDGPCRPDLERLSDELGIRESVRFLGEVRDVPSVLARAGMFALPSLSEGISLTLLEAMARGLPVIASRVGGNPEVVADGRTGTLIPPGDPEALAGSLLALRRAPGRCRSMGRAARERVEARFDLRRTLEAYEGLYREVLDRRGPSDLAEGKGRRG